MVDFKCKIVLTLTLVLFMAFIVPVLGVDYNPGVTAGQYVKYGNFDFTGSGTGEIQVDWMKAEVAAVSGKEVSIRSSGQLKNGTAISGSGDISMYNIETGKLNGTREYVFYIIIAGSLSEGDAVPPLSLGFVVNKTETRTYLGVSRSVNVFEGTSFFANIFNNRTLVYDKVSGMMLENHNEITQNYTMPIIKTSYSVIETNIFASEIPEFSPFPIFTTAALLTLLVALFYERKRVLK